MHGSTISIVYFEVFFLKIPTVKNFSPERITSNPYGGSIASIHTKIMNDLIIAVINKFFEFQNDRLKVIRIRYY